MAFDYGSIDLGLKNPFKKEGYTTAIRGAIQTLLGLYLLITAASLVKEDSGTGWILVLFGLFLLAGGLTATGKGIYATMRYFVGRNHPTSLARNFSKSELSTAQEEAKYVAYKAKTLEEMLVGRKNSTFVEPQGFLARLLHTFIPKLLFMPYPIRNMSQKLFGAWVQTITALISYGFVAFVSLAGFAGEIGELTFPIYSTLLMLYLLLVWRGAGKPIARSAEKNIDSLGTGNLVKVISLSLLLPVVIGTVLTWIMSSTELTHNDVELWLANLPSLNTALYLVALFILATACTAIILFMVRKRLAHANPKAEVSELRENWQESVHPNEIFINLDNLVMANRRYKEVPNRVYKELDPQLEEQVDGKGGFKGELLQEIQPKVKPMDLGESFDKARLVSLISGNALFILAVIVTFSLAYSIVDIYQFVKASAVSSTKELFDDALFADFSSLLMAAFQLFLIGYLIKSFALLLTNVAHLFFAEIQFESLLVYFKCEGTFTESKIATGTGIHDSTRSENTLVRSSITPWIITSRVVSTTFADTGMKNLEHPRTILEMHKNDDELQAIKGDVIAFLKDRESIASITSARDLGNASQIHQLNQQTRAMPSQDKIAQDDEAAGYLRQEEDRTEDNKP
ncbi:hypothetical protein KO495_12310 [Colwellia sp. D2M02]|uniref:hypothetical protein n=1 Tax=Colwellia sp. D2M02 TaxID=2841562 RepID=UPI001C099FC3|nr:hypothetical protein [Colwellia sp. D2M02]MBU2894096.1 hypothetical protein [Colwellia sp. D2M02]